MFHLMWNKNKCTLINFILFEHSDIKLYNENNFPKYLILKKYIILNFDMYYII